MPAVPRERSLAPCRGLLATGAGVAGITRWSSSDGSRAICRSTPASTNCGGAAVRYDASDH